MNPGGGEGLEQLHDDAYGAWGSPHRGAPRRVRSRLRSERGRQRGALPLADCAQRSLTARQLSLRLSRVLTERTEHSRQGIRGHARHGHCARAAAPPPARSTPHPAPHTARPRSRRLNPPTPQLVPPSRPRRRTALAPSHVTNDTDRGVSGVHFSDPHPKALHDDETDTAYRPRLQKI